MKRTTESEHGMSEAWEDRRRVKEEEYFREKNQNALKSLKSSSKNQGKNESDTPAGTGQGRVTSLAKRLISLLRF